MILKHKTISFFKSPLIWIKDKFRTVENKKTLYLTGFLPSIIALFGFIADATSLWNLNQNTLFHIIFGLFFLYGLINLYFSAVIQRQNVRLERLQMQFSFFHNHMIHSIRDYFAEKKIYTERNLLMESEKIEGYISQIMTSFNEHYMHEHHRRETNMTLKYAWEGRLRIVRIGNNLNNRKTRPESINNSVIFNTLYRDNHKLNYLYVKNIDKPDDNELKDLGPDSDELRKRSFSKFNTVIAIPLKAGKIKTENPELNITNEMGYISFDMIEKYGFGNLYEHEINIICSFVDLLSIIVCDLIKSKNQSICKTGTSN